MVETRQPLGGPEVRDLDLPTVRVDQHIVSLDVSMDNALVMEVFDPFKDLAGVVTDGGLIERAPGVLEQMRKTPCEERRCPGIARSYSISVVLMYTQSY